MNPSIIVRERPYDDSPGCFYRPRVREAWTGSALDRLLDRWHARQAARRQQEAKALQQPVRNNVRHIRGQA